MKKRGLLVLAGSIGLIALLVTPSMAQVIKLTLTDQNPILSTGHGSGESRLIQPGCP